MDHENVLLARQPIYDRQQNIFAYELLFRPETGETITSFDGNAATSRVLLNAFTESDLSTITGNTAAFVNFTEELIFSPPPFNPEGLVIEILETVEISPELVQQIKQLKQKGYKIALDDFVMEERYRPLLDLADIIKLELPAMDPIELFETIQAFKDKPCKLLAEKVETQGEFRLCLQHGCDYFQGYYLSKPEIVKGRKLSANKLSVLQLLAELQSPAVDIPRLNSIISRDPTLSYKLLKLINSASYRRVKQIDSIHMAVMLLGISKIKSWASLLALSKLDDKPAALHKIALLRAAMCEKIAELIAPEQKDIYFTTGLLSSLDIFFDTPLKDILAEIPIDETVKSALLDYKGKLGLAAHTVKNYEQSKWQAIHWKLLERFSIHQADLNKIYLDSISWSESQDLQV
jgi:EAL and modified HD-GYP domain-containing signal transduction protein